MSTADEYREKADECYRMANEAKTEADRIALLELAKTWLEAAARAEEADRAARQWNPKEEKA